MKFLKTKKKKQTLNWTTEVKGLLLSEAFSLGNKFLTNSLELD